jgi:hypothetical protein
MPSGVMSAGAVKIRACASCRGNSRGMEHSGPPSLSQHLPSDRMNLPTRANRSSSSGRRFSMSGILFPPIAHHSACPSNGTRRSKTPRCERGRANGSRSFAPTAGPVLVDASAHPQHLLRTTWNADRGRSVSRRGMVTRPTKAANSWRTLSSFITHLVKSVISFQLSVKTKPIKFNCHPERSEGPLLFAANCKASAIILTRPSAQTKPSCANQTPDGFDGKRIQSFGFDSGTHGFELVPRHMPEITLRHLAASGVPRAEEENLGFGRCHIRVSSKQTSRCEADHRPRRESCYHRSIPVCE